MRNLLFLILLSSLFSGAIIGCFQTTQSVDANRTSKTRTASDPMHRKTILDKDTPYDLQQEKENQASKEKGVRKY